MPPRPLLVWLRNDLRLHDHQPIHAALQTGAPVVPVYCFDPRDYAASPFGFPKTGSFRAQLIRESVADLRRSLQQRGGDLVVRCGKPEDVLPQLAQQIDGAAVFYHVEATAEEQGVERALGKVLNANSIEAVTFWGYTLLHPDDLPFELGDMPDVFTKFRNQVERHGLTIREPLPAPQTVPPLPQGVDPGNIPSLLDLGLEPIERDERAVVQHVGGETVGLARLHNYVWERDLLRHYKDTRNTMLGDDASSKFSAWLARGCLSPRVIYAEAQRYERERVRNESTYWLVFELLWRDFFRFVAVKHGTKLFKRTGLRGVDLPWRQDRAVFEQWQRGMTGYPLVDASMREMARTGFMSNRGRQNTASFLTKNLLIDWRMGAEWFESCLVDYDVGSNWGGWLYVAGVGNDARDFRFFNITKQAGEYDTQGAYVKHWLPELQHIPAARVHEPWRLSADEQERYGVRIGVDYPAPVVDLGQSAMENERLYHRAMRGTGNEDRRVRNERRGKQHDNQRNERRARR